MAGSQSVFSRLKPAAVALSDGVLQLSTSRKDVKKVEEQLQQLKHVTEDVAREPAFDARLADYVFFPIAQILKHSKQVSLQCLELSLSIVSILLSTGWRIKLDPALAQQLLILCTLLAGPSPPLLSSQETSTELRLEALHCLSALFHASSKASNKVFQANDASLPQIGQTLSTLLDCLKDSDDQALQAAAVSAVEAFLSYHWPTQMLWSFLPGIISTLTFVLKPTSKQRRSATVLTSGLQIVQQVLQSMCSDERPSQAESGPPETAGKILLALGSISKLSTHDRDAVRAALCRLHLAILEHCTKSLSNCIQLSIETIITIADKSAIFRLSMLVSHKQTIKDALLSLVHAWGLSLVRVMQLADDTAKASRLDQIRTAYTIIADADIDRTTIDQHLEQCLVDGLTVLLRDSAASTTSLEVVSQQQDPLALVSLQVDAGSALVKHDLLKQKQVSASVRQLIASICATDGGGHFINAQTRALLYASGDTRLARLWLALTSLELQVEPQDDLANMLRTEADSEVTLSELSHAALESIYSMAIDILNDGIEATETSQIKHLALQAIAFRAKIAGRDFRYELVDALYPVLDAMATPDGLFQSTSIITLNAITAACGYASVPEMIVDNADYLTNAIALKLNSFDVSPQGPRILLMMVQLAGSSLLPYLEDTVESIFAALEDYHGYPLLVELLFKTLSVMAQEGCKAPALLSPDRAITFHHASNEHLLQPLTIAELADTLRDRHGTDEYEPTTPKRKLDRAPQEPWQSGVKSDDDELPADDAEVGPPVPKIYNLLLKITDLTQHFLASSSISLRLSLLNLVTNTLPALAKHENSFLPLVNTLWPEIISRLDEDDIVVQAAALTAISALCENAKDFMRSRISDTWPRLQLIWQDIHASVSKSLAGLSQTSALVEISERSISLALQDATYHSDTALRRLWQAYLHLLVVIVRHVPIPPEHFDDALEMVKLELGDPEVFEAFNAHNGDAVWLCQTKAGLPHSNGDVKLIAG